MKKRLVTIAVITCVLAAICVGLWANRPVPRTTTYPAGPIVFILAGNLRPDVLGCYRTDGYTDTPNIDELAKDAIRFTNVRASEKTLRYIDGRSTTDSVFEVVARLEGGESIVFAAFEEAYRPFNVPDTVAALVMPTVPSPFASESFWGTGPVNYELEVRAVDHGIGEVLDVMRKIGLYDKSWIVVVSDARECFQRWHEAPMVPLLIKPPHSREASVNAESLHVSDVYDLLESMGAGQIGIELAPSDWPIANAPKKPRTIITIGDSLAAGFGAPKGLSYLDHLGKMLGCKTVNLAYRGLTSVQAVAKLSEVPGDTDVAILTLGSADVLKYVKKQHTLDALATMIDALQNAGAIVVCAVVDPIVMRNEAWSNEIRDLCAAKGVVFVPDIMDGIWSDRKLMSNDSLHPNGHGYAVIAKRIYEQLQEHVRK